MPTAPRAPFAIQSVAFAFPGNPGAIPLRDPTTLAFLGDEPEWLTANGEQRTANGQPTTANGEQRTVRGAEGQRGGGADGRSVPAAFVRGSRIGIQVVLAGSNAAPGGSWRIGARCRKEGEPGVAEQAVTLEFNSSGVTAPLGFPLDGPLPAKLGSVELEWEWYATDGRVSYELGSTRHELLLAWKQPIPASVWLTQQEPGTPNEIPPAWTYLPIMQWTCKWARHLDDEVAICDALLAGLPDSGLAYAVAAWNVYAMLINGGGYCGGWFRMFQAMAGAHGITLQRRFLAVDWRQESPELARWCAIVVEAPGLNRHKPAEHKSVFHDVDERPTASSRVERIRERRYRFWGVPGKIFDGHCVNFLGGGKDWILYDASFLVRAELRDFPLPAPNPAQALPVDGLGNFKEAYLDVAVNFMLGTMEHDGELYRTVHPDPGSPNYQNGTTQNGLTLETALLPRDGGVITFYWM